jgi:hypothetical protein
MRVNDSVALWENSAPRYFINMTFLSNYYLQHNAPGPI